MTPNYVFVKGRKDPLTTSELAAETGIERAVITNRAARSKDKKMYKGKLCGVLTQDDLRPPIPRSSEGQKMTLKLTPDDRDVLNKTLKSVKADRQAEITIRKVKSALKIKDGAKRAISAWDNRVRDKNA